MAKKADVAIVGVGSIGSMAAWQLAGRGQRVVGFEQFAPGHDRGAHGGESRIFRTAYLEGQEYVPLLQESERLWRQLEAETGRHLLTLTGGLMIGRTDTGFVQNVHECIERHGLDHEILDFKQAGARYPQHRYLPNDAIVLDKHAGFLRPELAVLAACLRAEELGAEICGDCRVDGIETSSHGVTIHAGGGIYEATKVVVAAGAWTTKLMSHLPFRLEAKRVIPTWFVPRTPGLFTGERFPVFIREEGELAFYGMPMIDGFSVKVALDETSGEVDDPDHVDPTIELKQRDRIRQVVREFLPDLIPDPVRVGVYQDAFSPDGNFVVGAHPQLDRVILLSGFSGHGFKMATVMGRIAADLVINGMTELPIDHLAPNRFQSQTGVPGSPPWHERRIRERC
jgi:sarcosine oxidase